MTCSFYLASFSEGLYMTLWNRILFWDTTDCTRTTQWAVAARATSTAWEEAPLQVVPRPATPQPCPPGAAPALPVWGREGRCQTHVCWTLSLHPNTYPYKHNPTHIHIPHTPTHRLSVTHLINEFLHLSTADLVLNGWYAGLSLYDLKPLLNHLLCVAPVCYILG